MKIVFIIGSLSGGGAERVVSELASQMSRQGDCVKIIMIASNKVSYVVPKDVEIIDCASEINVQNRLRFLKRIRAIRDSIRKINPDVCISFTVGVNIYAILSSLFLKTRLIIAERNDPRYDPTDQMSRCMRTILYPFADNIVFQTNGEKEFFSKKIQKKSIVIPNPVNPNIPEPFIGKRRKVFVSAARLFPQKNLHMSIDAFAIVNKMYPDFLYEIYGDGPLLEDLKKYAMFKGVADCVIFKGATNTLYKDIQDAFGFLLSSNYEGISNSMLEAMALGIPTISTDYPSGGAREIISNSENGFLVPVGDANRMAECMEKLIVTPELWDFISNRAINVRNDYNVKDITDKWIQYIKGK